MKFTISQTSLAKILAIFSKGVTLSSTIPVLNGVKITALESEVEFQSTDLTIAIKHSVPAHIEEQGAVLISIKTLTSIVKTLPDAPISFETQENEVLLTCAHSRFTLLTLPVEEFPSFPVYQPENSVELSVELLKKMVDRVYKVTSKDETRPILNGILCTVQNNTVRLVAVDSHRLSVCDTSTETPYLKGEFSAVIPGTVFHNVLSMAEETEPLTITLTDTQIVFSFGNTTLVSRKIEGNFPNYKQLIPQSAKTTITIPLEEFSEALRRVSSIATQNPSVRLSFNIEDKNLLLSTNNDEEGKAQEEMTFQGEGESLTIALNNRYITEGIAPLLTGEEKEVILELQDSTQPAIFKSFASINYLYLLMPIRI